MFGLELRSLGSSLEGPTSELAGLNAGGFDQSPGMAQLCAEQAVCCVSQASTRHGLFNRSVHQNSMQEPDSDLNLYLEVTLLKLPVADTFEIHRPKRLPQKVYAQSKC